MPVRSLHSSVLRWPEPGDVLAAARRWAEGERARRPAVVRIGVFGSYARGDAGVGSDIDLVAVVASADAPFEQRARDWALESLPVPADLLVYTEGEWREITGGRSRFGRMLREEVRWLD